MKGIASALHVAPESLFDAPAATAREALELIFRIDEEFGLKPKEIDGELVLAIDPSSNKAPKLSQALKAWLGQPLFPAARVSPFTINACAPEYPRN